jgi:hypothetical protein
MAGSFGTEHHPCDPVKKNTNAKSEDKIKEFISN